MIASFCETRRTFPLRWARTRVMTGGARRTATIMAKEVYYQFPQTPEQLRRLGSRGGKVTARHWRERRTEIAPEARQSESGFALLVPLETTADAIARLDAQFPWLRGAEKRIHPREAQFRHRPRRRDRSFAKCPSDGSGIGLPPAAAFSQIHAPLVASSPVLR